MELAAFGGTISHLYADLIGIKNCAAKSLSSQKHFRIFWSCVSRSSESDTILLFRCTSSMLIRSPKTKMCVKQLLPRNVIFIGEVFLTETCHHLGGLGGGH